MSSRTGSELPAVRRPWGGYTVLLRTRTAWVKKLYIRAGERTSLQRHRWRSEVWYVLYGQVEVRLGPSVRRCGPGDVALVPRRRWHRLAALSEACVLEVASGIVLERDIERGEDDYGRARQPPARKG